MPSYIKKAPGKFNNIPFEYVFENNNIKLTKIRLGLNSYKYVDENNVNYYWCHICELIKPINDNYFSEQKSKKSGYRSICKVCYNKKEKEKYDSDPEHKAKKLKSSKIWAKNNPEKRNEITRNSRNKRMEDPEIRKNSNEYHSNYLRIRRADDPAYKIAGNVSRLVRHAIKRVNEGLTSKGGKTFDHLPYTPQELVEHLESQFDENMSWENYGDYWHIDHIIPQAMLPYDNVKHKNFRKAWALDNLQPLTASENLSKNSIYKGKKRYYKENH